MRNLLVFIFFILLFSSVVSAETFRQWEDVEIRHPVRVNDGVVPGLTVNITIKDPNNNILVNFEPMTEDTAAQEHNYTLTAGNTGELGTYPYCITATDGSLNQTSCFSFDVTPSGDSGLAVYYFLIIILSYGVMVFGIWKQDVTITALGNVALYFVGIWVLFFGIDIFKNYLTNAFAIVTLGVAFYVSARTAHEYIIG